MNKIFCIGLPRTGTRSITAALRVLGFNIAHYPSDEETFLHLANGFYKLPLLETCDGISDMVASPYYAQFDEAYPGSRFILTTRDMETWLPSVARNIGDAPAAPERNDHLAEIKKFFRASCYGSYRFNPKRFVYAYNVHFRNVTDYFKDRPNDLLIMNLCGGQGWEVLCPFLGKPVPEVPFPFKGKKKSSAAAPAPTASPLGRLVRRLTRS